MLLGRENEFTDDVILEREERLVVAGQLFRKGGGSGERFATIAAVAVARQLLVGGLAR